MTALDHVEEWSRATDHLRAAIQHRLEMKGKQGEEAAESDYWQAYHAYTEATDAMVAALDPEG